jgi:hypothetical protein
VEKEIKDCLRLYGFLPLLLVLEQLEDDENFDLCNSILVVLKEHEKKYNIEIPTKYNEYAINKTKQYFMELNLSGEIAIKNNNFYASEILKRLLTK